MQTQIGILVPIEPQRLTNGHGLLNPRPMDELYPCGKVAIPLWWGSYTPQGSVGHAMGRLGQAQV